MTRDITSDWQEVNGVKYIECGWEDSDDDKPPNSPSELKQLAAALAIATKQPEPSTPAKKEELPITAVLPQRTRRVHGM